MLFHPGNEECLSTPKQQAESKNGDDAVQATREERLVRKLRMLKGLQVAVLPNQN
jgi:hypothetical protein